MASTGTGLRREDVAEKSFLIIEQGGGGEYKASEFLLGTELSLFRATANKHLMEDKGTKAAKEMPEPLHIQNELEEFLSGLRIQLVSKRMRVRSLASLSG